MECRSRKERVCFPLHDGFLHFTKLNLDEGKEKKKLWQFSSQETVSRECGDPFLTQFRGHICPLTFMLIKKKYFLYLQWLSRSSISKPLSKTPDPVNPFLFIRGLSCLSSVQSSLTQNWLKLSINGFSFNCLLVSCGDIGFLKNPRSSTGLEIRP